MPITVAIVEDDPITLDRYATALGAASDLRVIARCETTAAALLELPRVRPDVVLMDIEFRAGGDGIEATRSLKSLMPDTVILMLTVIEDDEKIFDAILAGADGYLLKEKHTRDVIAGIRAAAAGGGPMTPVIARKVLRLIQRDATKSPELASLSAREREVLQFIAQGLRDADVAAQLNISEETVATYLRRIYRKLHVHSRTEAAAKLRPRFHFSFGRKS